MIARIIALPLNYHIINKQYINIKYFKTSMINIVKNKTGLKQHEKASAEDDCSGKDPDPTGKCFRRG
jgi:hypothetical protein